MKKFTLAAVAALSLALPFAANAAKELRVAVNPTFPPFEFVNTQTNEITGFEMELVRAMGKHLGYDVKMLNIGFDGIIPAILAGTADVGASGFSVTEERKKRVLFTAPFYESGLTILVKKAGADKIKSFKDLEGRKVGVQIGTTAATMAKTIKDAKVSTFNNAGEAILDLQVGGTDAVINDRPVTASSSRRSRRSPRRRCTSRNALRRPVRHGGREGQREAREGARRCARRPQSLRRIPGDLQEVVRR